MKKKTASATVNRKCCVGTLCEALSMLNAWKRQAQGFLFGGWKNKEKKPLACPVNGEDIRKT